MNRRRFWAALALAAPLALAGTAAAQCPPCPPCPCPCPPPPDPCPDPCGPDVTLQALIQGSADAYRLTLAEVADDQAYIAGIYTIAGGGLTADEIASVIKEVRQGQADVDQCKAFNSRAIRKLTAVCNELAGNGFGNSPLYQTLSNNLGQLAVANAITLDNTWADLEGLADYLAGLTPVAAGVGGVPCPCPCP
jgi:hypothetical protein